MVKQGKITALVVALLLLVVSGCSKVESTLVGKWQNERLPEAVYFLENKTGYFEVKDRPSLPFKWSAEGDKQVKLVFALDGKPRTLVARIDKETLILEGDNQKAVYRKLK